MPFLSKYNNNIFGIHICTKERMLRNLNDVAKASVVPVNRCCSDNNHIAQKKVRCDHILLGILTLLLSRMHRQGVRPEHQGWRILSQESTLTRS